MGGNRRLGPTVSGVPIAKGGIICAATLVVITITAPAKCHLCLGSWQLLSGGGGGRVWKAIACNQDMREMACQRGRLWGTRTDSETSFARTNLWLLLLYIYYQEHPRRYSDLMSSDFQRQSELWHQNGVFCVNLTEIQEVMFPETFPQFPYNFENVEIWLFTNPVSNLTLDHV